MSILFASLILIFIASAYAVLLKRQLAETLFLSIVTVIGILYCFGLINVSGCLLYGIYCVVILFFSCITLLIYSFIKDKRVLIEAEIIQGSLIYILLLAFSLFFNFGKVFHAWDEFSHWGTIVKYFYSVDAFGTFNNQKFINAAPHYYPGPSLFQYFFLRFSDQFTEYYSYIGMNVIYYSLFLPFVKDIFKRGKRLKQLLLLIVFLLIPLQGFSLAGACFYSTLYVDAILGAFFGFTFLYYLIYGDMLFGKLMVSSSIFMLTTTKDMGLLFSLGAITIIIIDQIVFRRVHIKCLMKQKVNIKNGVNKLFFIIFPIIITFFVILTWKNITSRSGFNNPVRIPTFYDIYLIFTLQIAPYQKEIIKNFLSAMKNKGLFGPNISLLSFCTFFIIFLFVISKLLCPNKNNFSRVFTLGILIILGAFVYQFVLMVLYLNIFGENEALSLVSYQRYTSSYVFGMMFFMTLFFVSNQGEFKSIDFNLKKETIKNKIFSDEFVKYKDLFLFSKIFFKYIIFLSIGLFLSLIILKFSLQAEIGYGIKHFLFSRQRFSDQYEIRPTTIAANKWRAYFEETNAYLIAQDDQGVIGWMLRYELCPNSMLANKGRDYNISPEPRDPWTFVVSPEDWEKYVLSNEFKLVYVYKSNEDLQTTYGKFFNNVVKSDMFYRVRNENGHLILIPVELYND